MEKFSARKPISSTLVYAIVLSISILLLLFSSITSYVTMSIKFLGNILLYPINFVLSSSSQAIESLQKNWQNFTSAYQRIVKLEEEIEILSKRAALSESLEIQNRELKNLLGISTQYNYNIEVANIISPDFEVASESIIIDKGIVNGITKNMPVLAYSGGNIGLIGIVREVYLTTSVVETILSPTINIGVVLEISGEVGLLSGEGKLNGTCVVRYISSSVGVAAGTERVFTFSRSTLTPPGILVGTVLSTKKKEFSRFQEIIVKPAISIKNISKVMVVKSF